MPRRSLSAEHEARLLSCIETAADFVRADPKGKVIWSNGHTYFIPSGAKGNEPAKNSKVQLRIAGRTFRTDLNAAPKKTVGQLRIELKGGQAQNITGLLKRKPYFKGKP